MADEVPGDREGGEKEEQPELAPSMARPYIPLHPPTKDQQSTIAPRDKGASRFVLSKSGLVLLVAAYTARIYPLGGKAKRAHLQPHKGKHREAGTRTLATERGWSARWLWSADNGIWVAWVSRRMLA